MYFFFQLKKHRHIVDDKDQLHCNFLYFNIFKSFKVKTKHNNVTNAVYF